MRIRLAKKGDVWELVNLMRSIILETPYYTKEARKEEARKHNVAALEEYLRYKNYYICLVATDDKKRIVGFVIGRNEAGVFWADWGPGCVEAIEDKVLLNRL